MARLRPRARIIRTIGDQLISGPEAALIELVKNAYDADSPSVRITIEPPGEMVLGQGDERTAGGLIRVVDTGHGMSPADVVGKWFEPATNDKVERRLSPGGRVMLGAKGVGRFATARLGRTLDLKSVHEHPATGIREVCRISLDWRLFDQVTYLDEIEIEIETEVADPSWGTGVTLEIRDLRDQWTEKQLASLVRELRRLVSPVASRDDGFRIFLDLSAFHRDVHGFDGQPLVCGAAETMGSQAGDEPQNEERRQEIRPFTLGMVYHYRVEGSFDAQGTFTGSFINQRGEGKPVPLSIPAPAMTSAESSCGPVTLHLNIYDREQDAIADLFDRLGLGSVSSLHARRILNESIGIGIYRAGFRIRPYGDAETDWLELERRRVQDPSRKLGLNQVWGMVGIAGEAESGLVERTSREGLEHNEAFNRLRRLISDVLAFVEPMRQEFRNRAGLSRKSHSGMEPVKGGASLSATERAVSRIPQPHRGRVEQALKRDREVLKTAIAELETYQQMLASRASLGLVITQVLHDGRRFLSRINTCSSRLVEGASRLEEQSQFGNMFRQKFPETASAIHEAADQMARLFKSLDPISGRKRGRPTVFDADEVMHHCLQLFADAISDAGIVVERASDGPAMVTGYKSDLMAAILNILDNAIHWLGISTDVPRRLRLSCNQAKKYVRLGISNNGPVIDERYRSRLFDPGFTLKSEGSGIGLAIAREAMRASKGDVALDPDEEETTFVIEMRRAEDQ